MLLSVDNQIKKIKEQLLKELREDEDFNKAVKEALKNEWKYSWIWGLRRVYKL